MPNINIPLDDDEHKDLLKKKGNRSWKEMFLHTTKGFGVGETIPRADGDLKVAKAEECEFWNAGTDKPANLLIGPNTILIYTIYTLEKVE